jgi:hypothetical protein
MLYALVCKTRPTASFSKLWIETANVAKSYEIFEREKVALSIVYRIQTSDFTK